MRLLPAVLATALSLAMSQLAQAAEIKVVSGGAFKQVLNALAVEYRKETGTKLDITYRTVGQHLDLIRSGQEEFDVAVLTPAAIDDLAKQGKVTAGTRADLAKTGIGVVVKAGAAAPDISTVDAFKRALLAAKSVAFIDPKAGGSSGSMSKVYWRGSALPIRSMPRRCWSMVARWRTMSPMVKPRSAYTRSAKSCRLPASGWSDRCHLRSRISRFMPQAWVSRPKTATRRAPWLNFSPGPAPSRSSKRKGWNLRPEATYLQNGSARPKPGAECRYNSVIGF